MWNISDNQLIFESYYQISNHINAEADKLLDKYIHIINVAIDEDNDYYTDKPIFEPITTALKPFVFEYLHNIFVYEYWLHLLSTYYYNDHQNNIKLQIQNKLNAICNWCAKLFKYCIKLNLFANSIYDVEWYCTEYSDDEFAHYWKSLNNFNRLHLKDKVILINSIIQYEHNTGTLLTSTLAPALYVFGDDISLNDKITEINHRQLEHKLQKMLGY